MKPTGLNIFTGVSEAKVDKIKEAVAKIATSGFYTALEYSEVRKCCFRISTGSQEFDKLIGGKSLCVGSCVSGELRNSCFVEGV